MLHRAQQVATAMQGNVCKLIELYYQLGAQGLMWEEAAPEDMAAQRELLMARPARLSVPHLRQIVLAWERWVAYKPARAELYRPSPTHLGLFLQKESNKGPTVASSRMRGFRWLRANLGLPFPVEAAAVRDFTQAPAEHHPKTG